MSVCDLTCCIFISYCFGHSITNLFVIGKDPKIWIPSCLKTVCDDAPTVNYQEKDIQT